MDASCGPSSALSQLSKHTQRDQSLQHEFNNSQSNFQRNTFRSHGGIDANLNQEFQQFSSGGNTFDPHFAARNHQQLHQPRGQPVFGQPNQGWVQDFNRLSVSDRPAQKLDWHQQFMQQNVQNQVGAQVNMQQNAQNMQSIQGGQQMQYNMTNMGMGYRSMNYMQNQQQSSQQNQHQHQHQDLQHAELNLDDQFDQLEREMQEQEQEQTHTLDIEDETDKEKFADAARQVEQSMMSEKNLSSEETSSKFQNSDFLKLMSLISSRQVELSKEGDKLVEKNSGEDIRAHLSDPLKHEKEAQPDYHRPVHTDNFAANHEPQITNESASIASHLPDPLAHIKEGALPDNLTPLQAARIVSGGQVNGSDWTEDESWDTPLPPRRSGIMSQEWQEVYDDYRNDDDLH